MTPFAQPIPPEDIGRASRFVREMGWSTAYPSKALEAAVAAVQEEFDERGLGDATLIISVALDAAYEVAPPGTGTCQAHRGCERQGYGMSAEPTWTDQDAEAIAGLAGEQQRLAIIARGFEPVDVSTSYATRQYCPGLPLSEPTDELLQRVRLPRGATLMTREDALKRLQQCLDNQPGWQVIVSRDIVETLLEPEEKDLQRRGGSGPSLSAGVRPDQ